MKSKLLKNVLELTFVENEKTKVILKKFTFQGFESDCLQFSNASNPAGNAEKQFSTKIKMKIKNKIISDEKKVESIFFYYLIFFLIQFKH